MSEKAKDMVERVAQAIKAKVPLEYGMTDAEAVAYAVAAIEAMREVTPDMYAAGEAQLSHFDGEFGDYNVYFDTSQIDRLWPAMIDAALNPTG